MKVAQIIKTGEQVEILAVNGGWSTVRYVETGEQGKVRNGAITEAVQMSGMAAALAAKEAGITVKRAKAKNEPKEPRARKPINERLNGVVDALYLPQYQSYKATRKDGSLVRSMDKGDSVALTLRGMDIDAVYKHASKIVNASVADLQSRFEHLNTGMQRMNLGNMIRKAMKEAANA